MSTINICMTSYPRRIMNCVKVIQSAIDNTVVPDRIYLTLSHLEFPRYEQDLPMDLYKLSMTSDRLIVNWVEENTKSFKKVFPVLQYLNDDDIIITIDDDMVLPKDFIESRMSDFRNNGEKHPITSNNNKSINLDNLVMSCYSLFQKKMMNGYQKYINQTVINTYNDDRTYLYLCHLNGYKLIPCTKWCTSGNVQKLDLMPHGDYKYMIGQRYDNQVRDVIHRLSGGRDIGQCFGLFSDGISDHPEQAEQPRNIEAAGSNLLQTDASETPHVLYGNQCQIFQYNPKKPIKHDLVYVLGRGSKYKNLEIKISITSMLKFCYHWIKDIYIVGENPGIHNPRVKHVYVPDITKGNKDANIIHKIYTAIQKIPNLTDNFLFCSDDILVTKKSDWEDFAPRYVFEYRQDEKFRSELLQQSQNNPWDVLLLNTLDRFVGIRDHIYFYEPHIFAPINKKYFKKMCKEIDYTNSKSVIIMSLWFNWLNIQNPSKRYDHQSVFSSRLPYLNSLPRHISYNDKAFSVKAFRDWLINKVT